MAFRIIHSMAATSRFAELMKMLIVLFVNTGRGSPETIGYLCKCSPTHFTFFTLVLFRHETLDPWIFFRVCSENLPVDLSHAI